MDPTRSASKDAGPLRGGWMKVSHIGSWGEWTTPYKSGGTSILQGSFWGQNREGCTGLRVSVPWCELCSLKADNTSNVYIQGVHFHFSNSTLRKVKVQQDHAWKRSSLIPLYEFHDTRHFKEFMLNFKVPFSKGIFKWGLRASCTMPLNPTTIIDLRKVKISLRRPSREPSHARKPWRSLMS